MQAFKLHSGVAEYKYIVSPEKNDQVDNNIVYFYYKCKRVLFQQTFY